MLPTTLDPVARVERIELSLVGLEATSFPERTRINKNRPSASWGRFIVFLSCYENLLQTASIKIIIEVPRLTRL